MDHYKMNEDMFTSMNFDMFMFNTYRYLQNKECMFKELKSENTFNDKIELRCNEWYWENSQFMKNLLTFEKPL